MLIDSSLLMHLSYAVDSDLSYWSFLILSNSNICRSNVNPWHTIAKIFLEAGCKSFKIYLNTALWST
jgi:hypothetical protein